MDLDLSQELSIAAGDEDRQALLEEAAALVERRDAGFATVRRSRGRDDDAASILLAMKEERAAFGPRPELLPLRRPELEARGIVLDDRVKALLQGFDFYSLTFAVTLFPKRGWAFNRLECQIELNPGEPPERRPLAHDIYPASSWETLARANMQLSVGITEGLEFRAKKAAGLIPAGGELGAQLAAGANFVFPPRDYCIKRARILSRGKDNSELFWRLDDAEFFADDEPRLGLILKVPHGVQPLRARGLLAAYRNFLTLSADLGDLFSHLGERLQQFFRRGAPLVDRADWDLGSSLGTGSAT